MFNASGGINVQIFCSKDLKAQIVESKSFGEKIWMFKSLHEKIWESSAKSFDVKIWNHCKIAVFPNLRMERFGFKSFGLCFKSSRRKIWNHSVSHPNLSAERFETPRKRFGIETSIASLRIKVGVPF